jgi:hypothetical protein
MLLPDNFSDMTEQEFDNWARAFWYELFPFCPITEQKGGEHIES